jgi:hypothetical protein
VTKGSRWHFDLTPGMEVTFVGISFAIVFVEQCTQFVQVVPMIIKSSESVVLAIEVLRSSVADMGSLLN